MIERVLEFVIGPNYGEVVFVVVMIAIVRVVWREMNNLVSKYKD